MLTAGSRLDKSSDALRSTSPTALFAAHRSFERGRAREDVGAALHEAHSSLRASPRSPACVRISWVCF